MLQYGQPERERETGNQDTFIFRILQISIILSKSKSLTSLLSLETVSLMAGSFQIHGQKQPLNVPVSNSNSTNLLRKGQ
jgi:hypothetical protein